jgi:hypothetical protein
MSQPARPDPARAPTAPTGQPRRSRLTRNTGHRPAGGQWRPSVLAAENRNDDDTQAAPVTGEDLQRNRNARLALSVQVSRALRELGYCSLGGN